MDDSLHMPASNAQNRREEPRNRISFCNVTFNLAGGESFALSDAPVIIPSNRMPANPIAEANDRLIIEFVPRRLHTPKVFVGNVPLDAAQARHARDVLRLPEGSVVEIFDNDGATATGTLQFQGQHDALVRVEQIKTLAPAAGTRIIVAAAVPKGERADWMIEKLSELGVHCFIPLAAQRSVVLPEGKGKRERWMRIATESAKQSRRTGVMRIEELWGLKDVLAQHPQSIALSTGEASSLLADLVRSLTNQPDLTLLIGPEGGWTGSELAAFATLGIAQARLTDTTLRVETAAIAAAAIASHFANSLLRN